MIRREFFKIVIPLVTIGPSLVHYESSAPEIRFAVIADPQYADKDVNGTRFYRSSLEKLEAAIGELNKEKLDFVVTLGDIIDEDIQSFDAILPIYNKLKAPHHIVLGNHDWEVADEDKDKVLKTLDVKRSYYSEASSGWRMIYLDGTEESLFRFVEGSAEWNRSKLIHEGLVKRDLPNAKPWNGGISDVQLAWLEGELEKAKKANERVIISCHYPLLPSGDSHNLWNATEVVTLLDKYDNIAVYMNGHNHQGNYAVSHGTHYVNFKGMVETENESAYAILSCHNDRVEIQGYGLELDRLLT